MIIYSIFNESSGHNARSNNFLNVHKCVSDEKDNAVHGCPSLTLS